MHPGPASLIPFLPKHRDLRTGVLEEEGHRVVASLRRSASVSVHAFEPLGAAANLGARLTRSSAHIGGDLVSSTVEGGSTRTPGRVRTRG